MRLHLQETCCVNFMKNCLLALCLSFIGLANAQSDQHVVFGEWPQYFKEEDKLVRVFLDKNGHYYPTTIIAQDKLLEHNAALQDYYAANEQAFISVAKTYHLEVSGYSEETFMLLQDQIVSQLAASINRLPATDDLFLLIHGFRKPMLSQRGGSSSARDYAAVRERIDQQYADIQASASFIEVYWDGTYDCCIGRKTKVNKRIFTLFEEVAQVNASRVGYGLRQLVAVLDREELNIVTHSLGAQVGLSLLTNAYDDRIDLRAQAWPTPPQPTVNVCLVAPAIARKPFEEYHERSTALDFAKTDNYRLHILYNEQDFVLKKRWKIFGPGPKKYGDTSLGCNCHNEAEKLANQFEEDFPHSALILHESKIGGTHRFIRYVSSAAFASFLQAVNE